MAKYYIDKIRETNSGYNVHVFDANGVKFVFDNVHKNIVSCAVGSDLDYLLKTKGESLGFPLDASEIRDFKKYKG